AEVEGSLAAEAFIRERLDATLDRVRNAETARHSAENRYRRGLADIMSLLNARQDAFDAQLELESIRREALVTRVDLMLALGAGFDARRIYDTETPAPDAPGTRAESASE